MPLAPAFSPRSARPFARSLATPKRAVAALCAAALLAGCAQGEGPTQRQATGAALGAALGAASGLLVGGDDRRNALVGAGIGLIAGAAVGTYLDDQERALREDVQGTGADVRRVGDALVVTLPGGVTFDSDSARVKPGFRRPLNRIARTLTRYPSSYVDVIGHTDSTGAEDYNMRLSRQRARAVAAELRERGVNGARIEWTGRGESQPVATNATPEGRAANRRVEIRVVPATR